MKKFTITGVRTLEEYVTYTVEAETAEEAIELVESGEIEDNDDHYQSETSGVNDFSVTKAEEIYEIETENEIDLEKLVLKDIIGTPFKIENLEVAQYDFPEEMTWEDALDACNKLGEGWRVPNRDELNTLYQNMDKIGGFADDYYWSSTEYDLTSAWNRDFEYGYQDLDGKDATYYVRAIRAF